MSNYRPINNDFVDPEAALEQNSFDLEWFRLASAMGTDELAIYGCQYECEQMQLRQLVTEVRAVVAQGTQSQVRHEVETIDSHVACIPKTAFDWLKKLIIDFEPTLNFGWLKPEIVNKTVPTRQEITKIFWNVYPLQQGEFTYRGHWPSRMEWLTTTPPTDKQIYDAERDAYDNAMYMGVSRLF